MRATQTHDDPRASLTLVAFLILAILVLAFVVLAQVMFYNMQSIEDQRKVASAKPQELADLQAAQLAQISSYRYINEKAGVVAIPIDRAMEHYAREMKNPWTPPKITAPESQASATQPSGGPP